MSVEPQATEAAPSENGGPLVDIEHLKVYFPIKQGFIVDREVARVHAVNDVTGLMPQASDPARVGTRREARASRA